MKGSILLPWLRFSHILIFDLQKNFLIDKKPTVQ
jgi:hypothetical protein